MRATRLDMIGWNVDQDGNHKWDKSSTKSHPPNPSPSFLCQPGQPLWTALQMILPHICNCTHAWNCDQLRFSATGGGSKSIRFPKPSLESCTPLPPRSLGCQWGHPCRQRVMKQGGTLCCAFYFNPADPAGGAGVQTGEDWGPIIWDWPFANITDTTLKDGHILVLSRRVAAVCFLKEEEQAHKAR